MKIVLVLIISLLLSGCAGLGFNKKADLMPDEVSLSMDLNPHDKGRPEDWYVGEVTGGAKWKLK